MTTKNLELYFQHAPLADLAALAITSTVGMVNGLIVEVAAAGLFEFQTPAVATPDGRDVIVGNGGGVWIRQTLPALTTTTGGAITISKGGTSAVTQQLAINSLAGAVTTKYYLRGDGTNVSMSAIQEGDLPALTSYETVFNGVEDPSLIAITYDPATRIFSVTYTTGAAWTVGGVRYTHAAGTVLTTLHANTTGSYYLYYNSSGVLTVANSIWNLLTDAPLASIYYNASNNGGAADAVLQYEIHNGNKGMSNATHLNLHTTRGTQLLSGCGATGYTLNTGGAANVNWTTTSGSVADEDLILSVTAQALGGANTYRILWLTGTTVAPVWNWIDQAESGVYSDGTNIYYNQNNAGTWQLTAITNNLRWVNYYIVATTAYNAPQIIVVMGQNTYTSLSAAQAGTFATDCSNFGAFTSEAVVLYQVIYRRASNNGAPGNAEISAFTRVIQNLVIIGLSAATQASNVTVNTATFTNFFTVSDNNVQQALNDLDAGIPFSLAHGGTNANLTADNGGIFYSTATAGAILAGTATANRALLSGSSTTPAWSTATYPATTTINRILYSSNNSVIGEITTVNSAVLVTSAGGVPSLSTTLPAVEAGSCTCTDPTTASSASINTALSNVKAAMSGINSVAVQNFTSTGTYTPTSGMSYCIIECWGGGGAGGGVLGVANASYGSGAGGAGGYSKKISTAASIGASKTVTIGTAGAHGEGGNNTGGNGGDTSVGTICIAKGGTGAFGGTAPGAAGGIAGTGDITIVGQDGSAGMISTASSTALGGNGGSSMVGSGGTSINVGYTDSRHGVSATGYAAGGSGASTNNTTNSLYGGNGGGGLVIITEFIV